MIANSDQIVDLDTYDYLAHLDWGFPKTLLFS